MKLIDMAICKYTHIIRKFHFWHVMGKLWPVLQGIIRRKLIKQYCCNGTWGAKINRRIEANLDLAELQRETTTGLRLVQWPVIQWARSGLYFGYSGYAGVVPGALGNQGNFLQKAWENFNALFAFGKWRLQNSLMGAGLEMWFSVTHCKAEKLKTKGRMCFSQWNVVSAKVCMEEELEEEDSQNNSILEVGTLAALPTRCINLNHSSPPGIHCTSVSQTTMHSRSECFVVWDTEFLVAFQSGLNIAMHLIPLPPVLQCALVRGKRWKKNGDWILEQKKATTPVCANALTLTSTK